MDQYWSYLLGAVGLLGFVLAGRRVWWAWYINIAAQLLWATYAITTHQFGFLISAIVYSFVFWGNAIKWTRDHRKEKENADS